MKKWYMPKRKGKELFLKFNTSEKDYGLHLTDNKEEALIFTSQEIAFEYLKKNSLENDFEIIEK